MKNKNQGSTAKGKVRLKRTHDEKKEIMETPLFIGSEAPQIVSDLEKKNRYVSPRRLIEDF